jgi:hypothetical protein
MAELAESPKASGDVLFQHPSFSDQVLTVPADKVKEYEEAGWLRVKRDAEKDLADKAVPAPTVYERHFGPSLVP